MTKLYKFTQVMDGYKEPYFQMTGTLEDILLKWHHGPWPKHKGEYVGYSTDCYNSLYSKVICCLEKQKVYVEIVDAGLYSLGWVTKIEEIKE